jgi:hypothetical protein
MHPMQRGALAAVSTLLLGACGGAGGILVPRPVGFVPGTVGEARSWADSTVPTESREIRFRWQFRDDQGAAGGRGRVRWALRDSARLDVTGPLGAGRAAVFVSGDTAVWAQPENDIKRLVPSYPLFWGLLGVVRPPARASDVRKSVTPALTAWQYVAGADTVDYVRLPGPEPRLIIEVRDGAKTVGTVETKFGADGLPASARLIVPGVPARLDVTFSSNKKATAFEPDTWVRPEP